MVLLCYTQQMEDDVEAENTIEMLRARYNTLEQDIKDPYEAAVKIAGTIYVEGVMIVRLEPEDNIRLAVEQLKRHFRIEHRTSLKDVTDVPDVAA